MSEQYLAVSALQGYTIRPPKFSDTEMVAEMFNVNSMEITGEKAYQPKDIERPWRAPNFNKEESVRLVLTPEGQLAAYVEVGGHQEPHVQIGVGVEVHPNFRGMGIGSALLAWGEARAHEILPQAPEGTQVVMTTACNKKDSYRTGLYQRYGMAPFRHFFKMVIEFETPPQPPVIPEGIAIRPYHEDAELEKLAQTYIDSFQDHFGFSGQKLEDIVTYIRHLTENDPKYDAALWFAAVDGDKLVGFSLCASETTADPLMGNVNVLGVVRGWRKRGLGMALLQYSFVELYKGGSRRAGLTVDASSLTGATRLYKKAGMHVRERFDLYKKVLREGEVLIKQ